MKPINQLHEEVAALAQCLSEFQPPIPRKVMERTTARVAELLAACPPKYRNELANAAYRALGATAATEALPKPSRAGWSAVHRRRLAPGSNPPPVT